MVYISDDAQSKQFLEEITKNALVYMMMHTKKFLEEFLLKIYISSIFFIMFFWPNVMGYNKH